MPAKLLPRELPRGFGLTTWATSVASPTLTGTTTAWRGASRALLRPHVTGDHRVRWLVCRGGAAFGGGAGRV